MAKYEREETYVVPKTVLELLNLAKEREKGSVGFYEDMHNRFFDNAKIRDLLIELKDSEVAHVKLIEKKIEKLSQA